MSDAQPLRIATRASRLALWQADHVRLLLQAATPGLPVEIVHVSTAGDRETSEPLHRLGSFGVFTREVQTAVLDGQADLAVHSLKDLPTVTVSGLKLAAVPERGPIHDVLVFPESRESSRQLSDLPSGGRIGTGSPRRRAQLAHRRPDLRFSEIRGNVETRLRKLDDLQYDALVLAAAGLERLGFAARTGCRLEPPDLYAAVGQGALGIECRADDNEVISLLQRIDDPTARAGVTAERALLAELGGGCHATVGVHTWFQDVKLHLEAVVLHPDGQQRLVAQDNRAESAAAELGRQVAIRLREQGADELLAAAKDLLG